MQSHTGRTCLIFLHCAFSNASSNCQLGLMQSHTGRTCLIFLHCAFSNASLNCQLGLMQSRIGRTCLIFLNCAFSNASLNCHLGLMQSHTGRNCLFENQKLVVANKGALRLFTHSLEKVSNRQDFIFSSFLHAHSRNDSSDSEPEVASSLSLRQDSRYFPYLVWWVCEMCSPRPLLLAPFNQLHLCCSTSSPTSLVKSVVLGSM